MLISNHNILIKVIQRPLAGHYIDGLDLIANAAAIYVQRKNTQMLRKQKTGYGMSDTADSTKM